MFGATADRSRCLQNGEKSRCTFRTNVQCLGSFREYHANADSNTSKLFLILFRISKTKCWGLVIISHQWKGVGWVGGFWSPNGPPFKIFWPLPSPLPTPRRSMITTRTLLKNKIKKIGKRRRRLYSKAYQQKHLSSSTGWQWAHTADQSNSTGNRCNNVCCDKM